MSVDASGIPVQKDDYYPFGLTFQSWQLNPPKNLYGFQGQEYQEEIGWHQYKWRNADPALGRFFNMDPLAESFYYNSTYAFSENKVTGHVELEGLESFPITIPRLIPRTIPIDIPVTPSPPVPPVIINPKTLDTPNELIIPRSPTMQADDFDWDSIDKTDTSTWPDLPPMDGQGEITEGEPSNQKAKDLGQKRLFDEKGREYRPHKPDSHHPRSLGCKGTWKIWSMEKLHT